MTGYNFLNWYLTLRSFNYSLYARCILSRGRALGPFRGLSTGQLNRCLPRMEEKRRVRTTSTPSWVVPWLPNKSKMAAAAIFNFGKMSITPHWIKRYLNQILQEDASRPCADDHVTKSRNRKLIRVTSSNERLKQKCVDLSNQ